MTKYEGYKFNFRQSILGVQFLFVAFGALVLVPILTGLNANVALFTAGIGTLAFQLVTRKNVPPIFLASSFAFIAPMTFSIQKWGVSATMGGIIAAGLMYVLLSFLVRFKGEEFLHKLLPPVVVGPVVATIGLILSPAAVKMAMGVGNEAAYSHAQSMFIAFFTLICTIVIMTLAKGILKLIPILIGILCGYLASFLMGIVDFSPISNASWFGIPEFVFPSFEWHAILYMIPIAIAPAIEHIGDMITISNVAKEDFLKKPGLKNTLLGDGIATSLAGFFGGPPNTTYSEVTAAVGLTKSYNPAIMTWTAITAICLAFIGKLGAVLSTIPTPVIGGIMLLLFGVIASVGMQILIKHNVDLSDPRNIIIVSLIFVFAIGGMIVDLQFVSFSGVGLGAIVGIVLNLVLPKTKHFDEV
ncbi:uracil-xanthine permease family protein [Campylobacter pinnipediorum]|uniref:uracil-xanthine permease family protein n=1 Tax=Campylobacter pinnipediorum TaxID=1965231 RepID=UPI00084D6D0C|nr:uracil-xanthine permease family protein [Campylobacter pinnipediorum]AQW83859.1 xanthine/uracil permease [Campylobacter pinnipediorum subsp. pinnipediorum]